MDDQQIETLFAYLREHSGRYSLSALREQLLQTGYDPALVDRAIAIYQQENPPTFSARELVWPKAVLVLLANILLALLVSSSMIWRSNGFSLPFLIVCGEILGGIALLSSPKGRVWGRALLFGLLLTIAIPLLLVGVCILLFSAGQWH
ncbi:MAG TPA: hypothetical protein VGM86_20635 [Thermoanaerobaculia bacterium]|jgi:hypothetical protein